MVLLKNCKNSVISLGDTQPSVTVTMKDRSGNRELTFSRWRRVCIDFNEIG
jgi:hypothetical protein